MGTSKSRKRNEILIKNGSQQNSAFPNHVGSGVLLAAFCSAEVVLEVDFLPILVLLNDCMARSSFDVIDKLGIRERETIVKIF